MRMNEKHMPAVSNETAEERLAKFRRQQANDRKREQLGSHHKRPVLGRSKKLIRIKNKLEATKNENLEPPPAAATEAADKIVPLRLPFGFMSSAKDSSTDAGSTTSATASTGRSKGIALLKSLMANSKGTAAAAAAFTGKKLPLPAKAKISKAIRRNKQNFKMRLSKQQQREQQNASQGPPTLVNFFKRGQQRASKSKDESRQPIKYETFTDKDRAAAVLLGDADIKTTLEKQLKSGRLSRLWPETTHRLIFFFFVVSFQRAGSIRPPEGEPRSGLPRAGGI